MNCFPLSVRKVLIYRKSGLRYNERDRTHEEAFPE